MCKHLHSNQFVSKPWRAVLGGSEAGQTAAAAQLYYHLPPERVGEVSGDPACSDDGSRPKTEACVGKESICEVR